MEGREIKFRIWLGGRFHYWGFIKGRSDYIFAGIPSDNRDPISHEKAMARSQQLTGLKDKNGVDIYEGDILEGHDDGYGIVEWWQSSWIYKFADDNAIGLDEACIWFGNNCEVIGNIYENPELLEANHA